VSLEVDWLLPPQALATTGGTCSVKSSLAAAVLLRLAFTARTPEMGLMATAKGRSSSSSLIVSAVSVLCDASCFDARRIAVVESDLLSLLKGDRDVAATSRRHLIEHIQLGICYLKAPNCCYLSVFGSQSQRCNNVNDAMQGTWW
jgi:hypothetical protein